MSARAAIKPFHLTSKGVTIAIKLMPGARAPGVRGLKKTAQDNVELEVAVTAAAEKGRANRALCRLLADEWGLPASTLEVIAGLTDRHKVLRLTSAGIDELKKLEAWLQARTP